MKRLFIGLITCVTYFVGCTEVYVGLNPEDILNISVNSIDIGCEGGNTEVIVESMCAWKIDTKDCSWATIDTKIGDKGKRKLTITVLENTTCDKRTATFSIGDYNRDIQRDIIITQDANTPNLELSTTSIEASMDGITKSVSVKSNVSITVSSSEEWCTVDKTTLSRGNNQINISIEYNHTTESRSAIVTLSNKEYDIMREIEIVQEALEPNLELSTTSIATSMYGDTKSVTVKSNVSITVSSSEKWCTVDKTTLSRGDNQINISIEHNHTTQSRSAIVTFSNEEYDIMREIEIVQEASTPEITVDMESLSINGHSATEFITIQSSIPWIASCDLDWLSLSRSDGEIGRTTLSINISRNETGNIRQGSVILSNDEYQIYTTIIIEQESLHVMYYTALSKVTPYNSTSFNVNILDNIWEDGKGEIFFDGPITYIGKDAFRNCDNLTSITIPSSVTTIGDGAFYNCKNLTSITIPNSVTEIGEDAFFNCDNLTSITIPNSVTEIGDGAFHNCDSLTSVTIPDSVTTIGNSAFSWCKSLTSVTIGDSVTSIGNSAFWGCDNLTSITIPDSVTEIGEGAFFTCNNLTSVTIGNGVISIGDEAFWGCENLTNVTIGSSVTEIGERAFSGCKNLKSITIPNSVTSIGEGAFYDCENLTNVTIGSSVTEIGADAFRYCTNLTSITIPNSVTSIGSLAFYFCDNLTSITIPNSVTTIGDGAFSSCKSLEHFYGKFATSDGKALIDNGRLISYASGNNAKSYAIPNSVTEIGWNALIGCNNLTSITIPDSVTEIGQRAFSGCDNLKEVYCKATTPPDALDDTVGWWGAFDLNASGRKIYVPRESVQAYKSAYGWDNYASAIVGYDF